MIKEKKLKKKFNLGLIIFARCGSKRLPGKVLKKINNRPILNYIVDRVKKIRPKNKIIIATTTFKKDDAIVNFCKKNKISFFRGPNDNVLLRAINCCKKYKFDAFMRICADRIFFDYNLASKMIKKFRQNSFDIITNSLKKTFPRGMTCEIIKYKTIKDSYRKIKKKSDKEHILNYFYRNNKSIQIINIRSNYNKKIQMLNLSIDSKRDFIQAKNCLKKFKYKSTIDNNKIISYYLKN